VVFSNTRTPQQRYRYDLQQKLITQDQHQQFVVAQLQKFFDQLIDKNSNTKSLDALIAKFLFHVEPSNEAPRAIYLWGGVG